MFVFIFEVMDTITQTLIFEETHWLVNNIHNREMLDNPQLISDVG